MVKKYIDAYFCGVGSLRIAEEDGKLTGLLFESSRGRDFGAGAEYGETPLLAEAKRQLEEYFRGERKAFNLPLAPRGTPFQLRCWDALQKIPYGATATYADIARAAGSPKGFRAAGLANNRNPIAIIIPCHRVIGSNGALVGFGGGLEVKAYLLRLEARFISEKYYR